MTETEIRAATNRLRRHDAAVADFYNAKLDVLASQARELEILNKEMRHRAEEIYGRHDRMMRFHEIRLNCRKFTIEAQYLDELKPKLLLKA